MKWIAFAPTTLAIIGVDQLGKLHAATSLPVGTRLSLIGDVLALAHFPESGVAFGFLNEWTQTAQLIGFALLSVVTTVVIASFYRGLAPREFGCAAGLGAILGGVLSLSLDRIRTGSSVDFLHVGSAASRSLPDFNLADLAIVLGVVTLIVELLATEMAARASERPRR